MSTSAKTGGGSTAEAAPELSPGERRSVARLGAVQALYQIELSQALPEAVLQEFLQDRLDEDFEGLSLSAADREFLVALVSGVAANAKELDDMMSAVLVEDWPVERLETLLRLILRAGAYELAFRPEIPARVAITEYVRLTQAFFDGKEPGMTNGVLDRLAHSLREEEFEEPEPRPRPGRPGPD